MRERSAGESSNSCPRVGSRSSRGPGRGYGSGLLHCGSGLRHALADAPFVFLQEHVPQFDERRGALDEDREDLVAFGDREPEQTCLVFVRCFDACGGGVESGVTELAGELEDVPSAIGMPQNTIVPAYTNRCSCLASSRRSAARSATSVSSWGSTRASMRSSVISSRMSRWWSARRASTCPKRGMAERDVGSARRSERGTRRLSAARYKEVRRPPLCTLQMPPSQLGAGAIPRRPDARRGGSEPVRPAS